MGNKMVGRRFKECREKAEPTQAELAGKVGCTEQYISVIERGINFPAYNRLVRILNILDVSADAVLRDVLDYAAEQRASELSEMVAALSARDKREIFEVVELLVRQAEVREKGSEPSADV
ncbi:helix-turn-helix transcriptional regulator [Acutalibacter sp. JLR.KK004]|jgi:transcriptional regulator with XRE-family HTH domain|uniref:helix-turn-helix domain-containing protein n=1 Tax=Acutalibacter sp. JLR.KK004 TaxID=3112622 RepID=UPI002FF25D9B|nr:helix-turn-helix transcriptional regulator [Bacillota bacterium]